MMFFWDIEGPMLVDFKSEGQTIGTGKLMWATVFIKVKKLRLKDIVNFQKA